MNARNVLSYALLITGAKGTRTVPRMHLLRTSPWFLRSEVLLTEERTEQVRLRYVSGTVLSLANGVPFEGTFERVFKGICPDELEHCLRSYGQSILSELSEKQIVIDGKKKRDVSPTTRGNGAKKNGFAYHLRAERQIKFKEEAIKVALDIEYLKKILKI